MSVNTIYLKQIENGAQYEEVANLTDADLVQVPAEEYISIEEWNSLIDEYELLKDQYNKVFQLGKLRRSEDTIVIPQMEYHGLLKALRIVRERSLQHINKAVADIHGYAPRFCEERVYDRNHPDQKAFLITKSTPISLKIDLQTASFLIRQDLGDFYNYININDIRLPTLSTPIKISASDLLLACHQRDDPDYSYDFYVDNSEQGRLIRAWLDSVDKAISFEVAKITSNIGQGVYDITYWATGPI